MRQDDQLVVQIERFAPAAAGAPHAEGAIARPANQPIRAVLDANVAGPKPDAGWDIGIGGVVEYGASSLMGVTKLLAAVAGGEEEEEQDAQNQRLERCVVEVMQASWGATGGGAEGGV
jgi:hypothetical protein